MKKLTAKQEQFVFKIIEGCSKTEAYKSVYDTSKMKDKTISKRAYDLFNKDDIQKRYNRILEELKETSKWTIDRAIEDLIWLKKEAQNSIEDIGLKQSNSNAFLSAIKELNTLLDLYPKKNVEEDTKEDKLDKIFEGLENVFKARE